MHCQKVDLCVYLIFTVNHGCKPALNFHWQLQPSAAVVVIRLYFSSSLPPRNCAAHEHGLWVAPTLQNLVGPVLAKESKPDRSAQICLLRM